MKIKEIDGETINVFGVYWHKDETLFLGFPQNYNGLLAYGADEVEIIDPVIDFRTVYFKNRMHGIFHWALIEENLLDDVIDHDPKAFNRFIEILKSEGVLEPDFV